MELVSEQVLFGDLMRAQSINGFQQIDSSKKSYLKRLKGSEIRDLGMTLRKLTTQFESFVRRA